MTSFRIGWIGTGNMGAPICRNLIAAGHELVVHDIDPARLAELRSAGAAVASDAADLVARADLVFSMVPNDKVLLAVVEDIAGRLRPGQTFIDMSTVSPATSARVFELLAPSGAAYLRAPVSGSTAGAAAGTLAIYCSGPRAAYDAVLPVFGRIGSRQSHVGLAEEARVLKLLINMIVCITPAVVGEALAFGQRSGLDWTTMIEAIGGSAAASPLIGYKSEMMKRRDWTAMASVDLIAKDLDLALDWGRARRVPMPFTALAQQVNSAFQASGDGNDDFFSVVTWPERLVGGQT
ncbi:MAG: NAD(P)-dependent oxidoreductase [Ferrovibrionaceae bacterium]